MQLNREKPIWTAIDPLDQYHDRAKHPHRGAYGVVGQRIAAELAPDYSVIVAGRHLEQAEATAAAIGHGVRGRELDVNVEASIAAALQGVAAVVSR